MNEKVGRPEDDITEITLSTEFDDDAHLKPEQLQERSSIARIASDLQIDVQDAWAPGKIELEIFEKTVEHQLVNPVFITAFPTEVSPLARRNDQDPGVSDRFELFVCGREIANGFSELNDYEDQAQRVKDEIQRVFNPEFMNRLDDVIVFHPLNRDHIREIVDVLNGTLVDADGRRVDGEQALRGKIAFVGLSDPGTSRAA